MPECAIGTPTERTGRDERSSAFEEKWRSDLGASRRASSAWRPHAPTRMQQCVCVEVRLALQAGHDEALRRTVESIARSRGDVGADGPYGARVGATSPSPDPRPVPGTQREPERNGRRNATGDRAPSRCFPIGTPDAAFSEPATYALSSVRWSQVVGATEHNDERARSGSRPGLVEITDEVTPKIRRNGGSVTRRSEGGSRGLRRSGHDRKRPTPSTPVGPDEFALDRLVAEASLRCGGCPR
jgi:hypothetical protein